MAWPPQTHQDVEAEVSTLRVPAALGTYPAQQYLANEDFLGSFGPAPNVIGLCPFYYPIRLPISKAVVSLVAAATTATPYELGVYDRSGTQMVSFGTLDLAGAVGNIALTLPEAVTLSGFGYLAGKLRATSANGGTLRRGKPYSFMMATMPQGNPWDSIASGMANRGMLVAHAGTGALPSTLPLGSVDRGEMFPLVSFQPS